MFAGVLKQNKWFFIPYLVVLSGALPVLLMVPKAELHLWLNGFHNGFFDAFFRFVTWFGNGVFICSVGLFFLFFSMRNACYVLSVYLSTGILVQVLKRFIFPDVIRPIKYFQHVADLHLVEGVKLLGSRSFPSGHATSAFAFFLCLAMISKNRWIKLTYVLMAVLVSYSRVYLSQHFLIDIYVGSVIGCIGAVGMYMVFYHSEKNWHTSNIVSLIKRK